MVLQPWFKLYKKFTERNQRDFYNIQEIILGKNANAKGTYKAADSSMIEEYGGNKLDE